MADTIKRTIMKHPNEPALEELKKIRAGLSGLETAKIAVIEAQIKRREEALVKDKKAP
jgi:restriction endonuclease S subunit